MPRERRVQRPRDERRFSRGYPRVWTRPTAELQWPERVYRFFAAWSHINVTAAAVVAAWVAMFIVQKYKGDPRQAGGAALNGTILVVSWHEDPTPTVYNSTEDYYCNQHLDIRCIFKQIGDQVLSQKQDLVRMQQALSRDQPIRWVAFVGPPGVGKTTTTDDLRQTFPWKNNIFWYSWSPSAQTVAWRYETLGQYMRQLSDCGIKLIVIDMLPLEDYTVAIIFDEMLLNRYNDLNDGMTMANQTVLLVYAFVLTTQNLEQQIETLHNQISPETPIVSFRSFDLEDLQACLVNQQFQSPRTPPLRTTPIYYVVDEDYVDIDNFGYNSIC